MFSFVAGEQLAQIRPAVTTAIALYTAQLRTEITRIVICNNLNPGTTFSVYHDDDGTTLDETTALHHDQSLSGNTTVVIESPGIGSGLFIAPGGTLGIDVGAADSVTVTLYGITEEISE